MSYLNDVPDDQGGPAMPTDRSETQPSAPAPKGVERCHAPCGIAVCWLPRGHVGYHVCGSVGGR